MRPATHASLFAGNREIYEHQDAACFTDSVRLLNVTFYSNLAE